MREDSPMIVKIFADLGFVVHFQTDGFNVSREKIREIIKAGCRNFTVSLDSLKPEKHDYIRSYKGSWINTIQTLAYLTEELSIKRSFLRTITTVVSRYNIEELPQLVKFATKIGFYIFFMPLHLPSSTKICIDSYWEV